MGTDFSGYDFSCGTPGATVAQQPAGSDVERFGATCTGIGFQKAKPEYGNCILRLMEKNSSQATEVLDCRCSSNFATRSGSRPSKSSGRGSTACLPRRRQSASHRRQ
jgi:hypothetical protein